nr:hypothetical protein [Microvirga makkahensis]
MPGNDRSRSRQPRLGIVDVYDLDRQRQLLLLRRDNVEHLLLIGGPNDVVIETNIVRVAGARLPAAASEPAQERLEPAFDQSAPRPAQAETGGRPSIETQLAAQLDAFVRRPSENSDVDQELAAVDSISAPVPAHAEPLLKPDNVSISAAPAGTALRAEARMAPPQGAPVPPQAEPRPAVTPPPFQSRATPTAPTPPASFPTTEPARPSPATAPAGMSAAPAVKTGPDAAVLSNMAKQLEEALKRPAAPVTPPTAPTFEAGEETAADEDDLLETAQAEEARTDDRDENLESLVEEPVTPSQPEPPRPAGEPVRPAPSPLPLRQPEPAASPAARKEPDPFSVEDIEAEFARLLGRPLDPSKKG